MKNNTYIKGLRLAIFFAFIYATVFSQTNSSKEMLISVPYLTDKNAVLIQESLKNTPGVQAIEACYPLHVMVIRYDSQKNSEETLLETLRKAEINSTVELLFSRDIQNIRHTYKLTTIVDNFQRKQ
ncbi:MAG: hypothetical protein IPP51_13340 [Bacteroidetes bacterium]|nr:hypothetical protein [Bacteroidota bacterium]